MPMLPVFFAVYGADYVVSDMDRLRSFIVLSLSPDGVCYRQIHSKHSDWAGGASDIHEEINIEFINRNQKNSAISFQQAYNIVEESSKERSLVQFDQSALGFSFVTLALTADSYRKVIYRYGVHGGIEALLSSNDFLATKEFLPHKPQAKDIRLHNRLMKSLVTTSEQLFLINNGRSILDDTERAAMDHAQPEFDCRFRLPDGKPYDFKFRFGQTSDLGRRAAVLIGKNGCGKSQTLRHIAKMALSSVHGHWYGNFTPSRVLAFYTGARLSKIYPPQTLSRKISGYKVHNLSHQDETSASHVVPVLLKLIETDTRIAGVSRYSILQDIIRDSGVGFSICIHHSEYGPIDLFSIYRSYFEAETLSFSILSGERIDQSPKEFIAAIDVKQGLFKRKAGDFSSGEEAYVRFCVFSAAHTENGSLLLLDEPEVYLHPQFIDALMGSLHKLLELTGSVAVVATHSAYVVRCVEEELVHIIKNEGYEPVEVQKPRMKTFGADVGMISLFVFGEDEMATTLTRAMRFHQSIEGGRSSIESTLKNFASEDLIARIVNADEEN